MTMTEQVENSYHIHEWRESFNNIDVVNIIKEFQWRRGGPEFLPFLIKNALREGSKVALSPLKFLG